jgi:carboxymethylenebutenolidase
MGEMVEFPSNGSTCGGYLATPPAGTGPGVVVIQEWWGLVDHIKDVSDRFASEGFVALAPDLYHGVATTEPDEANKLMMELNASEAARDMGGAFDFLRDHESVSPKKVGAVGFCMGGMLTFVLAANRQVDAAVPFYGLPGSDPGYDNITAPIMGHFAANDDWGSPDAAEKVFDELTDRGKDARFFIYPGCEHAFFNDARPEVYDADAASTAWYRTLDFFRTHLT